MDASASSKEVDAETLREAIFRAEQHANVLNSGTSADKRAILLEQIERIDLSEHGFTIRICSPGSPTLTAAFAQVRVGNDIRMLVRTGERDRLVTRDEQLAQTIADARAAQQLALRHCDKPLAELALLAGRSPADSSICCGSAASRPIS